MDGNAPLDTPLESVFTAAADDVSTAAGCDDLWGHGADAGGGEPSPPVTQAGADRDLWQSTPDQDAVGDHGRSAVPYVAAAAAGDDPFGGQAHSAPPPAIALDVDTRGPLTRLASRTQQHLTDAAARTGKSTSATPLKAASTASAGRLRARGPLAQARARLTRERPARPQTQRRTLSARGRQRLVATGALALAAVALVTTLGQLSGGQPTSDRPTDRGGGLGAVVPETRKRLRPLAPDAQPRTRKAQPQRDRATRRRPRRARAGRLSTPRRRTRPAAPAPAPPHAPVPAPTPVVPPGAHSPSPADAAGTPAPAPTASIPEVP